MCLCVYWITYRYMVSEVKLQYGIVQYVAAAATARHSSLKCSGEVEAIRTQVEALLARPWIVEKGRRCSSRNIIDGHWTRGPGGVHHVRVGERRRRGEDPTGTGPVQSVLRTEEEHTVREVLFQSEATANRRTYDQYKTALKKLAEGCDFAKITPDEILRDRLLFGIADNKVRERLLRESNLTLEKTDDLCHASERMAAQLKIVADKQTPPAEAANAVSTGKRNVTRSKPQARRSQTKEIDCSYCGQRHAQKKELCPAYGKNALPPEKTTTLPTSAAHRHGQRRGRSTTLTTRCSQRRGRLTSKSRS